MTATGQTSLRPVVMLFLLAPFFGECLQGNLKLSELGRLIILVPLYGAGAVLIREVVRRRGLGFGAVLTLGVAYALMEEMVLTQLLLNNAHFAGQAALMKTALPWIGADLWLTMILVAMHAGWSITIPIVLVEAMYPARPEPWLGRWGLAVTAVIFLIGAVAVRFLLARQTGFSAPPLHLIFVCALIAAIIVLGLRYRAPWQPGQPPRGPVVAGAIVLASSAFFLTAGLPGHMATLTAALIATASLFGLRRWSARSGWTRRHTLWAAAGATVTYFWLGAVIAPESGPRRGLDTLGPLLYTLTALAVLVFAFRRATPSP